MNIIDLHCDTIYEYAKRGLENLFINENFLLEAKYIAQVFAIYTPSELHRDKAFKWVEASIQRFKKYIDEFTKITISKDIKQNINNDNICAILSVENAEFLDNKIERLKFCCENNVRILGLIHNGENCLGYPHTQNLGLKKFGKEVIEALENTNIIIDVSHLSLKGFFDVANLTKKPFIASHSACREIQENTRNLFDKQIKIIAQSGGVVGVPFYSYFLNGTNKTGISDIIYHLEHLIKVGGENVAAFGTDFDGMQCDLGIKNALDMKKLVDEIIKNFGSSVAEKICYKNALRIL